jgi:hypothetical protein
MPAPNGVVWILGAGFSRFLGAPLMADIKSTDRCLMPIAWPLYAQEFIGLVRRQRLLEATAATGFE